MAGDLEGAAAAIRDGELVVYPTETVYGLGADALEPAAIERVFAAKDRPRDDPLSLAVPTVAAAAEYVELDGRTRACMDRFLPGPVTVVGPKAAVVPDALTGGRDRVGVRVPDHHLARALLVRIAPVTATSANVSGRPAVREPDELDPSLRAAVAVVLDGGRVPGGASTVVDPGRGVIHRRGRQADAVEAWLAELDR
ncbi:MAG: L-threonylcarbamoyladenylate synthase [Halobacteriales archaeon]